MADRRTRVREVAGSNRARTKTQGLLKVLLLKMTSANDKLDSVAFWNKDDES